MKELFSFFPIRHRGELDPVCEDWGFERYGWFPKVSLNMAENLLAHGDPKARALNGIHESGRRDSLTYGELRDLVGEAPTPPRGVPEGGEISWPPICPTSPRPSSLALRPPPWGRPSLPSPAILAHGPSWNALRVSRPTVLVAALGYEYKGLYHDCREAIARASSDIPSLKKVILVDFLGRRPKIQSIPKACPWESFLDDGGKGVSFLEAPFAHPLYILYSSGTTGPPKAIVHSQGGTLLQHIKELGLHTDMGTSKHLFYFTTCSWMMWHWSLSALFFGGTITLYEGSPNYPSVGEFFSLIEREDIHIFGTSPKFLSALRAQGGPPPGARSSLETILSTGAPLTPDIFDFVYGEIKEDVHLASISGGSDIIGCFVLGNLLEDLRRGEIQGPGLGMDVDSFDGEGHSLRGQRGELVCKRSFPL